MKSAITRCLFVLLACLLLTGCSQPIQNFFVTRETELFSQGLDQYIASGDLTTMQQLPQKYPQGEWRLKAEAIIDMANLLQQQKSQLEKKDKKLAICQEDKALADCQKEKTALAQDNRLLEETLKSLKEVLIDTEKRTK